MKISTSFFIFVLLMLSITVTGQQVISAEEEAFFQKAMTQINLKHVNWVKEKAGEVNRQNMDVDAINAMARNYGQVSGLGETDIMALTFIVMMEAAKSAREDLKAIMDGVKEANKEKEHWREVSNQINKFSAGAGKEMPIETLDSFRLLTRFNNNKNAVAVRQPVLIQNNQSVKRNTNSITRAATLTEINQVQGEIKGKLDALNEMSEMTSLRLQMTMDSRSKLISTLSNLMKKISSTQDTIIQNLK